MKYTRHHEEADSDFAASATEDGVLVRWSVGEQEIVVCMSPDWAEEIGAALIGVAHGAAGLMRDAGKRR